MVLKNDIEIEGFKQIGSITASIRDSLLDKVIPGISTYELDAIAFKMLKEKGARSAPKKDYNFPGYTCISVNHHSLNTL